MKKRILARANALICLIIVLNFALISILDHHANVRIVEENVERVSNLTAESIYYQVEALLAKPISISTTMANDPLLIELLCEEEERLDDADFLQRIQEYLLGYQKLYGYDSVFLISTATGRYYHFQGIDRVLKHGDPENRWYDHFLDSSKKISLNVDNDQARADDAVTVFVNCKLLGAQGQTLGVAGVGFRADWMQKILEENKGRYGVHPYLLDAEGTLQLSSTRNGHDQPADFFKDSPYAAWKSCILAEKEKAQTFWQDISGGRSCLTAEYIPSVGWYLLTQSETTQYEQRSHQQFLWTGGVMLVMLALVLTVVTRIMRRYNRAVIEQVLAGEQNHQTALKTATEKLYDNIYDLDITHDCAADESTEQYFKSMGVPSGVSAAKAMAIIAQKSVKKEFRAGFLALFDPENVRRAYAEGRENQQYDLLVLAGDGASYQWMRLITQTVEYDRALHLMGYYRNIDEEKRQERRMLKRMEQDSLSGLYNKAALQHMIEEALAREPERPYAFFIMDIDDFKRVNDTLGHAAGDQVIVQMAARLRAQFSDSAILGRIGGDEFAVLAAAAGPAWAAEQAWALNEALRFEIEDGGKSCAISASIGVAVTPEAGGTFEQLYRNADSALYQVKAKGKNSFAVYQRPEAGEL